MYCVYPKLCIYYNEIIDKNDKYNVKMMCDYKDKEIKDIPIEEIENCIYHKTYRDIEYKV